MSLDEARQVIEQIDAAIEIVQCGNVKRAAQVSELIAARGEHHRLILGNDSPSGTGVMTWHLEKYLMACLVGWYGPGSGCLRRHRNTARVFGLNRGRIAQGLEADLVFLDTSIGSTGKDVLSCLVEGDTPGVSVIMIDGKVVVTPPTLPRPCARPRFCDG